VRCGTDRPAAFDQQRPTEGDDKAEDDADADAVDASALPAAAAPVPSDNGIKMLNMSFADLHMNRNRRKGHFDEDDEDDEDEDDE